jgi:hypothetical protein
LRLQTSCKAQRRLQLTEPAVLLCVLAPIRCLATLQLLMCRLKRPRPCNRSAPFVPPRLRRGKYIIYTIPLPLSNRPTPVSHFFLASATSDASTHPAQAPPPTQAPLASPSAASPSRRAQILNLHLPTVTVKSDGRQIKDKCEVRRRRLHRQKSRRRRTGRFEHAREQSL